MKRALCILIIAFAVCAPQIARAHPVTFPGNLMLMGELDKRSADINAAYTFRPDHAVSVGYMRFEADDGARRRSIANLHYNYRLKRWNLENAQANIYVQAGAGNATGNDFSSEHFTWLPAVQADYETRHIYLAYRWHGVYSRAFSHSFNNVQAGFAFHAGEYDEISPWFILDVRRMSNLGNSTEVTPTLRLIHKSAFIEFGLVDGKRPRVNLMFNF